jgi:hypothetical protein
MILSVKLKNGTSRLFDQKFKIHHETGRDIEEIQNVGVSPSHFDIWDVRQERPEGFKDPSTDHPLASKILKNWIKGFDTVDKWIGSHVDDLYKIPLSFLIRQDPKPTFVEPAIPLLDSKYAEF